MSKMYYDDYSNGCVLIPKPHPKKEECCDIKQENECKEDVCEELCCKKPNQLSLLESFLPNFKLDDIILIAIILMFLNDGCEDKTLLIVIGVIFLLGFSEKGLN